MTNFPTLLGTGGHYSSDATYAGDSRYYSPVCLGRHPMDGDYVDASYVYQIIRVPGTISYLSWGLDNNTFEADLVLALDVNLAWSDLAVPIDAMTSGWMTDSTDSVSVSNGDKLNFAVSVGAGGSSGFTGSFYCISARFDSSDITTASAQLIGCEGPCPIPRMASRKAEPCSRSAFSAACRMGHCRKKPSRCTRWSAVHGRTWRVTFGTTRLPREVYQLRIASTVAMARW